MRHLSIPKIPAVVLLIIFCTSVAGAQSDTARGHKKVTVSKKTKLKIVRDNGNILQGKWSMETSDALCLKLNSGRDVIVPKDDIAQVYHCKRNTNFGFFIGTLSGIFVSALFLKFSDSEVEDIYLTPVFITAGCGLMGAVIGSMHLSCDEVDINDLTYYGVSDAPVNQLMFGVQFSYRF
jgi:hypothetical protein